MINLVEKSIFDELQTMSERDQWALVNDTDEADFFYGYSIPLTPAGSLFIADVLQVLYLAPFP